MLVVPTFAGLVIVKVGAVVSVATLTVKVCVAVSPFLSVAVTVIVAEPPSLIGPLFVTDVIVGATLFTTTFVVNVFEPLSLSKILPRTGKLPLSPKLQLVEVLVPAPAYVDARDAALPLHAKL